MIKNIIFDWGGVLIENPDEELVKYCSEVLAVDINEFREIWKIYSPKFQRGVMTEQEIWQEICQKLHCLQPQTKSLWRDAVEKTFRDQTRVWQEMEKLKKQGKKIYFLSNTEEPAREYFLENHYEQKFDGVIFSCVEKLLKPELEIYQLALNRFNIKPKETVFVDDKLINVEGAQKVGIKGILFKSIDQFLEDLKKM